MKSAGNEIGIPINSEFSWDQMTMRGRKIFMGGTLEYVKIFSFKNNIRWEYDHQLLCGTKFIIE